MQRQKTSSQYTAPSTEPSTGHFELSLHLWQSKIRQQTGKRKQASQFCNMLIGSRLCRLELKATNRTGKNIIMQEFTATYCSVE